MRERERERERRDRLFFLLYILRGFRKLVIAFFPIKNIFKLINQQLKNKIVNW